MSLTVKAYAKVNLWLDITQRRPDGFHDLNTVMRRIDLYDDVTVDTNGSGDVFILCDDPEVPTDERNVAYRAAKLFFASANKNLGAIIRITKRIPKQAGLGGSSTDGAAVLTALNTLCGKPFGVERLCSLGAKLGADVPFCITGGTARCNGIGDIIQPIDCTGFAAVVVIPELCRFTADAYLKYDLSPIPERPGFDAYCGGIGRDRTFLARNMYNIFEAIYADPRIGAVKKQLTDAGALGACMSGSGSAVFGIFDDMADAQAAVEKIDGTAFAVRAL